MSPRTLRDAIQYEVETTLDHMIADYDDYPRDHTDPLTTNLALFFGGPLDGERRPLVVRRPRTDKILEIPRAPVVAPSAGRTLFDVVPLPPLRYRIVWWSTRGMWLTGRRSADFCVVGLVFVDEVNL